MKRLFWTACSLRSDVGGLHPLHSAGEIWFILNRERSRADRLGTAVSLVIFGVESDNRKAIRTVKRILAKGTRLTDEIGDLGMGSLCAVLPETDAVSAAAMARRIVRLAMEKGIEIDEEIYSYPEDQHDRDRDDANSGNGERRRRPVLHQPVSNGEKNPVAAPVHRSGVQIQRLEELLVLPHPRWKRCLDVIGSATLLTLATPVLLAAAALIKLSSPGPVVFCQERAGQGGKPFKIYKFRTMVVDAERHQQSLRVYSQQDGPAFKLARDPRITRIGKFLRNTSIDELPQLWNVLKGDMSLVGPRPLPTSEAAACHPWQRQRLEVMPGLTCIWQVRGRCRVTFNEWVRMDMEYIRQRSLFQDLKLLLQTFPAVVIGSGAH